MTDISLAAGGIPLHQRDHIAFVKRTQNEEFDTNYNRANAIVLCRYLFEDGKHSHLDKLTLIAHELYRVISRFDSCLRRRTQEAVGCLGIRSPLILDDQTRSTIITNPDADEFACAIPLTTKSDDKKSVVPATVLKITNSVSLSLSDVTTKLFMVDAQGGRWMLVSGTAITNYDHGIGINTGYFVHAGDIVAGNVPVMLTERICGVH